MEESPVMTNDRSDPVHRALGMYAQLLETGLSQDPRSGSTIHLLKRFENAQIQTLMEFGEAETQEQISRTESLLDTWLQTQTDMWKASVENDSLETLQSLRQLLSDINQFREGEYAFTQHDINIKISEQADLHSTHYKQRLADGFRRRLAELQFAAYAWAFHLFKEDELSEATIRWVLETAIPEDFGSVRELSEMFFRMREARGLASSWEQWNMNRELDRNFGVATTGPATSTWLLSFYCSALVWITLSTDQRISEIEDPQDSPALDYADRTLQLDQVLETLELYKETYPLESLLIDDAAVERTCENLTEYFEGVQATFKQQEREWTRAQPIDNSLVEHFEERANSRLNDSTFRAALTNLKKITEVDDLDDENTASFDMSLWYPRRLFVETGISTTFTNSLSPVLTRYREFVINQLNFKTQRVSSHNRLPQELDDIIGNHTVELIITGGSEPASTLRNHEKSNRTSNRRLRSYLEYGDTPVLNDFGADYLTLVLYEVEFAYEESSTNTPLSIDYTPGESVDDWQDIKTSSDADPSDWVRFNINYDAVIQSDIQTGILLTL
ncbi:hypothetical protein [Halovivax cerinus]|uniref:Uncharacterized protein n=1 Tax=Halovivax cerinus TaxID=1487865 RepID=A0ABD5NL23_9EURY|nr:hypothetical protein [Halovivax cerinus]